MEDIARRGCFNRISAHGRGRDRWSSIRLRGRQVWPQESITVGHVAGSNLRSSGGSFAESHAHGHVKAGRRSCPWRGLDGGHDFDQRVVGYLTHGTIGDRFGRKTAFALFFLGTAVMSLIFGLLPVYLARTYSAETAKTWIVIIGPILSFFTGYFSGYGAYYAEFFPTRIRGSAVGFCFNIGRIGTSIGPGVTGALAASLGVGGALAVASLAFLIVAILIYVLPETLGTDFRKETVKVASA